MLKFSTENYNLFPTTLNKIHITCPYCGHTEAFIYELAKRCMMCDEILPNAVSLMKSSEERLHYHKMGTTLEPKRRL